MAIPTDRLRRQTLSFVSIAGLLTIIGLVFIYSSSSILALEKLGSAHYFLRKQLFFVLPSIIGFFAFALTPIPIIKKYAQWAFFASLGLTALTFVPYLGLKVHGSNRWLSVCGIGFQPSEFLKLTFLFYVAYLLDKKQHRIKSFLYTYVPMLIVMGITFGILLKQPDFGSVITLFSTSIILLFVAECRMSYLVITALCACPAIIYLVMTKSYRLNRILIFLNPWADPQGKGFQIIQSLIAIGSGQTWGLGLANSKQKFFYLPMQHTDFIFPIIAEETGFIGSVIIVALYAVMCFLGLRIAARLKSPFTFLATVGFVMLITIQAVINIMVTCGLLPTKGLGLPFISYGGTALMSVWCMVGFIVNASRSERE